MCLCGVVAVAGCYCALFDVLSEDSSRLAARKYARVIQKLGFPVSVSLHGGGACTHLLWVCTCCLAVF